MSVRPLHRRGRGAWCSHDGRWTFLRHYSDPKPQRWFAYEHASEFPSNEGLGHTSLGTVTRWAEQQS